MVILGALVNGLATFAGGLIGLGGRSLVSQKLGDFLMSGLGLCVILVGIDGMLGDTSILVVIISMVIGSLVGYLIDLDGLIGRLGRFIQDRLTARFSHSAKLGRFSEGFVAATLFICVGSMAVVGSLQSGLELDHSTLFAKALIDMVVVAVMATTLGVGVPFSGICVFVYEAALSLTASALSPLLTQPVIEAMTTTGSLLLLAVGLNMLEITHIKVANMLPAAFAPLLFIAWL